MKLYQAKKESADGRALIWKLSLKAFMKSPFFGEGYGQFEKAYTRQQVQYFAEGHGSEKEIMNAGFVRMAYNEYLENGVQGGIIGLLLFLSIIISLIVGSPKVFKEGALSAKGTIDIIDKNIVFFQASFSGVCAFAFMGIMNFTFQAIPVMCIFIFYAAIVTSEKNKKKTPRERELDVVKNKITIFSKLGISVFFLITLFMFYRTLLNLKSELILVTAKQELKKGNVIEFKMRLNGIADILDNSEDYWTIYSKVLYKYHEYNAAISSTSRAIELSFNPDLFLLRAKCYERMGNYPAAEHDYIIASNIVPSKFRTRALLMRLYIKMRNRQKAIQLANGIIGLKPKINSDEVMRYKVEASQVLKDINFKSKAISQKF